MIYCVVEDLEHGDPRQQWREAARNCRVAGISSAVFLTGLGLVVYAFVGLGALQRQVLTSAERRSGSRSRTMLQASDRSDGGFVISMDDESLAPAPLVAVPMPQTVTMAPTQTTTTVGITTTSTTEFNPQFPCGLDHLMAETDLKTEQELRKIDYIPMEYCHAKCEDDSNCSGWTWGKARHVKGLTDTCFMKRVAPGEKIKPAHNPNVVSGVPCHRPPYEAQGNVSLSNVQLFCWALFLPNTYEQHLLAWQFSRSYSLFECDRYAVYSNESIEVAPGLPSLVVKSNLHCEKGGEFMTALNRDIFLTVWKEVAQNPDHLESDWTIKVDADCVFFPSRLRVVLAYSSDPSGPRGVYLNNCWRGLHGPIEVLSRHAVSTFVDGIPKCKDHYDEVCSGDCKWGEDMFMDQCMGPKVLNVKRDDAFTVLVEDHCDPPAGWETCEDTKYVAYHPFKNKTGYQKCFEASASASRETV